MLPLSLWGTVILRLFSYLMYWLFLTMTSHGFNMPWSLRGQNRGSSVFRRCAVFFFGAELKEPLGDVPQKLGEKPTNLKNKQCCRVHLQTFGDMTCHAHVSWTQLQCQNHVNPEFRNYGFYVPWFMFIVEVLCISCDFKYSAYIIGTQWSTASGRGWHWIGWAEMIQMKTECGPRNVLWKTSRAEFIDEANCYVCILLFQNVSNNLGHTVNKSEMTSWDEGLVVWLPTEKLF